jgi:hypothetical protein
MISWSTRPEWRLAVLAAVGLLALCASSCGSSDDDGAGDGQASAADAGGAASDRQAFQDFLNDIEKDFVNGDGDGYCSRLTASAKKELGALGFTKSKHCAAAVAELSKRTNASGVEQKPTKVLSVEVDGDVATARVRDGGRPPADVRFVKRGGEWKLPTVTDTSQ